MAKNLVLLAALLATLLATSLAYTTTTTTVITTTNDDESNPGQYQQCQSQLQGRRFRACQNYFTSQGRRSTYDDDEISEANPGQQEQQYLRQCCDRIRQVNEQCQCEAIKKAVRGAQQHGGSYEGGQMSQVYQKASSLPRQCGLRVQRCQIRAIFV